ncbi:TRAP transporter substrate-binding protein [Marinomonas transparens]|uniref:TRAP transporter substrate-binding protein n=1 Tax=Marinomonas transparens TaxID=2795388 RepID=A0A934MUM3_9GAMM|nr:TRAP transporter substrate-binding protein [Marinomonas transparens]MBJ7536109.1 TRAP transporter substrate-binding protein [Marinomonas transparens]
MTKQNICRTSIPFILAGALFAGKTVAGESLSIVGSWSSLPLYKQFEQPFWTNTLPNDSKGEFSVSMTTHDQMGIGGGDVFRMLGDGVFDIGMTVGDYAVADAPALEGLDVPLVANTAEEVHKMVNAARPMVGKIYETAFNSKVLAIVPYPPQVVFCKAPVSSLDDLSGLKIRASGRMTAKFLDALGAQSVNIGFGEVPGALQRGVIDCAVTGAGSGYSAGWWEVTTTLMTIPLGGWDPVVTAINLDKWNDLSSEQQAFLQAEVATKFEKPVWDSAQSDLDQDVACLTGNGECSKGPSHSMALVEPSDADLAHAKNILTSKVLPDWADRAGDSWVNEWNGSVGKTVGLQVSATGG